MSFKVIAEASEELQKAQVCGYLEALVMAIDLRHADTQEHSKRVAKYSIRLAKEMGLDEKELSDLSFGVLLHDIGKIRIPDRILVKPAKLTDDERKKLEKHPIYGYKIVKEVEFLSGANPIVLHHHERYDGSGYPKGLAKDKIPIGARILAVIDAYDAITSDRPYRKGSCYEVAKAELLKGSGSQFDPEVVAACLRIPRNEWEALRAEAESEVVSKTVINAKTFTWLAANVVHELGNPLGAISSTLQYVRDTLSKSNTDNPQIVEALETVMDSIGQMHEILRELSELSSSQSPRFEPTDLRHLIFQMLGFIHKEARRHNIKIYHRFEENLPDCEIAPREMKQLLLNLLKNAIEAMPNGGKLQVKAHRLKGKEENQKICIDIADSGHGIRKNELRSIFRPFYSTKPNGSGLGLPFCRQVVEEHSGKIRVKSKWGKGSAFSVILPVKQDPKRWCDEAFEGEKSE